MISPMHQVAEIPIQEVRKPSVIFFRDNTVASDIRCDLPAAMLSVKGYQVNSKNIFEMKDEDLAFYDVWVFQRPLYDITQAAMVGRQVNKKIIVDVDDDFRAIPKTHPSYNLCGPGNVEGIKNLEKTLGQADVVTVSTPELARRYADVGRQFVVIPNGWNKENANWIAYRKHSTVNLGWCGTITHRDDFAMIRRPLERVVKENKNVRIVIGADEGIYKSFTKTPETQKIFLPGMPYYVYPYMFSFMDILLVPLKNDVFNGAKSDIKLVEAGARGIPYIASPLPIYLDWGKDSPQPAGLYASSEEDWYSCMSRLVSDASLRRSCSLAGRKLASQREMSVLVRQWEDVINGLMIGDD
jgi:glycosyltransferase involved in cell wall biosynthesis